MLPSVAGLPFVKRISKRSAKTNKHENKKVLLIKKCFLLKKAHKNKTPRPSDAAILKIAIVQPIGPTVTHSFDALEINKSKK